MEKNQGAKKKKKQYVWHISGFRYIQADQKLEEKVAGMKF